MTGYKQIKLPFWGTILTLLGVAVLLGLGTWQIQRLHWKQDILAKLDAAYAGEIIENSGFSYQHVEGIFLPDKAILLGPRVREEAVGHDLIVPLQTPDGTVFVDMGWTGYALEALPIYHLQDRKVRFEGLARAPGWNMFTPDNKPADNLWYKPDLNEIAAAKNLPEPLPFMLYAEQASYKFDAQFPNNQRWSPPNNHLQYAFFWFAMAGAMVVVYVLRFVVKR